ncbi:MAG: hypothetical protein J7518_21965 [Nocardioidaceae bacterium]|nr:hypothetical protein [Nocardioidaceae bacterium]
MRRAGALVAVLLVVLLVLLCACTTRAGSPAGESAWREQADKVLGAAMSSLGTARVVLENDTDLPHPYAVVTLQDAITSLHRESGSFLTSRPPDDRHTDNDRVVAALGEATTLLTRVSTAVAANAGTAALRESVRKAYDDLDDLRTKVAGS